MESEMEQDPVTRDERFHDGSKQISSALTLWLAALVAFIWMGLTSCMCGHGSWMTMIVTVPAFCYAIYVILCRRGLGVFESIFGSAAFALVTWLLLKNIADILWLGHEPLLY